MNALLLIAFALPTPAQDPSCGNWSTGPDVIVGNLTDIGHYGAVGTVSAYSIGTDACNFGDTPLVWEEGNNQHPVIAQHMYRYEDGRFEQLFGTPHGVDLCALAEVHGVPAERVSTRTGFQAAVAGALTRGGTRVVVVRSDRRANVALHQQLHDAVAAAWERDAPAG